MLKIREVFITFSDGAVLPPDPEATGVTPRRVGVPRIRIPTQIVFPESVSRHVVGSRVKLWVNVRVVLVPRLTRHH